MNGIEHEGPALVARALPDGFSRVDDVAVRLTMAACAPTRDEVDEAADVRDVACARLRGRGAEEVVAALHAALPARPRVIVDGNAEGVCLTFHELASSALRRPLFTAR